MIDKNFFENHLNDKKISRKNFRYFSELILDAIADLYYLEILKFHEFDLFKKIDFKKLKLYIKKETYLKSLYFVNNILNHYYLENNNNNLKLELDYNEITSFILNNTDKNFVNLHLKKKNSYIIKFYSKLVSVFFLSILKKLKILDKKSYNPALAIHYVEGIDELKRNDFFWYNENFKDINCIIYFSSRTDLKNFERAKEGSYIKKNSFKKIDPLILNLFYNNISSMLFIKIFKIFSSEKKNSHEYFLFITTFYINLIKWYTFFKKNNIRVHYENQEGESSHILKNISLDLLNGFSFSKERTLMSISGKLNYYASFSADVRFHNNILSLKNYYNTFNLSQLNLISNYPYKITNKSKNILNLSNEINKGHFHRKILFFDSNHSKNMNLYEISMIPTDYIESIYKIFSKLIEKYNICLIIKSKKSAHSKIIYENEDFKKYINKNIFIINDPFGLSAQSLIDLADFSVAVGTNLSSALIEFVSFSNKNGVFLNYHENYDQNTFYDEYKINNLIIDDLNKFEQLMINYLKGDNQIGNWCNYLSDLSVKDKINGHDKISYFLLETYKLLHLKKEKYFQIIKKKYEDKFN